MSTILFIGTNNPLHEEGSCYENITITRELNVMDLELLKFINNDLVQGS